MAEKSVERRRLEELIDDFFWGLWASHPPRLLAELAKEVLARCPHIPSKTLEAVCDERSARALDLCFPRTFQFFENVRLPHVPALERSAIDLLAAVWALGPAADQQGSILTDEPGPDGRAWSRVRDCLMRFLHHRDGPEAERIRAARRKGGRESAKSRLRRPKAPRVVQRARAMLEAGEDRSEVLNQLAESFKLNREYVRRTLKKAGL